MENEFNKKSYIPYGVAFGLFLGAIVLSLVFMLTQSVSVWFIVPGISLLIGIVSGAVLDSL